jgi:hypothetical protein
MKLKNDIDMLLEMILVMCVYGYATLFTKSILIGIIELMSIMIICTCAIHDTIIRHLKVKR